MSFDRIDIGILVNKLLSLDCPPFLIRWVSSFLQLRFQRVKHNCTFSSWLPTHAGVPQGTRTGPIAFLIMINDLLADVKYVDDSTLLETAANPEEFMMQNRLEETMKWTELNHMKLNGKKTQELRIDFSRKLRAWSPLVIGCEPVEPVTKAKLLGVTINNSLNWNDHIAEVVKKTCKRIYFIRMLKRSRVCATDIIKFYEAQIRSVLCYAAPVWHSCLTSSQTNELEGIQRRVYRIVFPDMTYSNALQKVGKPTLTAYREALVSTFFQSLVSRKEGILWTILDQHRRAPLGMNLRQQREFVFRCRTDRFRRTLLPFYSSKC